MGLTGSIDTNSQRREYSRVDAYIPFEYRVIAPEEGDHVRARIFGNASLVEFRQIPDMEDHDNVLEEWMKILDSKLDTVIRLLTLQREGYFGLSYKAVNISGGGMSFRPAAGPAFGRIAGNQDCLHIEPIHSPLHLWRGRED